MAAGCQAENLVGFLRPTSVLLLITVIHKLAGYQNDNELSVERSQWDVHQLLPRRAPTVMPCNSTSDSPIYFYLTVTVWYVENRNHILSFRILPFYNVNINGPYARIVSVTGLQWNWMAKGGIISNVPNLDARRLSTIQICHGLLILQPLNGMSWNYMIRTLLTQTDTTP